MTLSRRAFLRAGRTGAGIPSPAIITARGREAMVGEFGALETPIAPPMDPDEVRISSNENPYGPGPSAIQAIRANLDQTMRYPMNSRITEDHVVTRLAKMYGAKPENIVIGMGSSELLRNAVRAFAGPDRPLVTAACSYENPVTTADIFGIPVRSVPNASDLGLDLDKMAGAAMGAGLVFLCNPNNPTATVCSKDAVANFVRYVSKESPYTYILIDEAYHDYATNPAYDTSAELALRYRNVFVTRTFSKAYGMAGLRQGYAVGSKHTIDLMKKYELSLNPNILGLAAVNGSLDDPAWVEKEVERNTEVRKFTLDFFRGQGYWATDSNTNFIFVKINKPAKDFREACAQFNVKVGRDFPPFEKSYARISIGTMDEMRRATEVFAQVLGTSATDAGAGN